MWLVICVFLIPQGHITCCGRSVTESRPQGIIEMIWLFDPDGCDFQADAVEIR